MKKDRNKYTRSEKLAFALCLSFWCAPICTAPLSLAFLLLSPRLLLLRSPPVLLPSPLLPPSSPSGSSSTSTTSSLFPGDDRVVLGRVVVDETLRLLWEGIRFVLVWDLELGLVKGKSERCDVSLLTFVKTKMVSVGPQYASPNCPVLYGIA